jgi:hypothetical protein
MKEETKNCSCLGRLIPPKIISDFDDNQKIKVLATFIGEKGETFQTPIEMTVAELKNEMEKGIDELR